MIGRRWGGRGAQPALWVASLVPWAAACGPAAESTPETGRIEAAQPRAAADWGPIVEGLVQRLRLEPDERVFGVGLPGLYDELPGLLAAEVGRAGGTYVGTLSGRGPYGTEGDPTFQQAAEGLDQAELRELLRDVPVGVMLPGAGTDDAPYAAMQDLLRENLGRHRTVHFHWAGAYDIADRSFPIGAVAAALPAESERVAETYRSAILDVDYAALSERQRAFERAARDDEIRVTTPAGTELRFRIGDRPVNRQDGDISGERALRATILIDREIELPAGAIRVAPLESSVAGIIVFPRSRWNDVEVEGLRMEFTAGGLTSLTAESGLVAVEAELEAGAPAARFFREFGLGFNPLLAVPENDPWLPYFGYGDGVVRLSLGDNSELGGAVGGGYVRWNFFLDATVRVGGELWVENGHIVR